MQVADNLSLDLNTFVAACFMIVTGIQLMTFGVLSRFYADITGILPRNSRSDWLASHISTDRLALNAGICLLGGVAFFGYAVLSLGAARFRPAVQPRDPAHRRAWPDPDRDWAAGLLLGVPARRAGNSSDAPAGGRKMKALLRAAIRLRAVRFLTVGVGAALLFFALTYAFVSLGMPPFAGAVIAYAMAFVVAYSAQRSWTFGGDHDHSHALPRYFVLQVGCALGSGLLAHVAVESLQMSPLAMSALTTVAASLVSYVVSSLWVFADHSRSGR